MNTNKRESRWAALAFVSLCALCLTCLTLGLVAHYDAQDLVVLGPATARLPGATNYLGGHRYGPRGGGAGGEILSRPVLRRDPGLGPERAIFQGSLVVWTNTAAAAGFE